MAFRRTFQLVITIVLIGIFIGISPADCEDKVEDRSSKDYDDFAVARQESPTPSRIRRLMEFIRLRLSNNQVGSRTFHQIKKFQSALLPIMYKLGVISTIIMITLFMAAKGVFIGTIILIMNVAFIAAKLGGLFDKGHSHHGYTAALTHAPLQKDVHLHIHNGQGHKPQYIPYTSGYSSPAWEPSPHAWNTYGPPHESGRQMTDNPDEMHTTSTDKSDNGDRDKFEIIYPAGQEAQESRKMVSPYNYIKHYQVKRKT